FVSRQQIGQTLANDFNFGFLVGNDRNVNVVEAAFERGRQVVHSLVAGVSRGNDVETGPGEDGVGVGKFGDGDVLVGDDRDEGVLHVGDATSDFLESQESPDPHRDHRGGRNQVAGVGAFGNHSGDVPGVFDVLFGRAGGSLNGQRRVAADCSGQML